MHKRILGLLATAVIVFAACGTGATNGPTDTGVATASLLVAVLVGPKAVHVTDNTYSEVEPASFYRQTDRAETQQELARLNTLRRNAAPSSTQWVGAVMRPASASRWHPDEDEGGASSSTPTEAPRSQSAGIRPI